MPSFTDHQLVVRYLKGDQKSFDVLVARYMDPMYRFVYGYAGDTQMAQDITQEVFVKVFKNIKKVDKNKNFKSWIYTIAKNTALDFLKKKKSIPFSQFETFEGKNYLTEKIADHELLPDKISESLESKKQFLTAIEKLSFKYQQVLTLYYYKELNFREIAEFLREPINTIKSKHRRGVMLLKKVVGADLVRA